jgi:hypothetical protein
LSGITTSERSSHGLDALNVGRRKICKGILHSFDAFRMSPGPRFHLQQLVFHASRERRVTQVLWLLGYFIVRGSELLAEMILHGLVQKRLRRRAALNHCSAFGNIAAPLTVLRQEEAH